MMVVLADDFTGAAEMAGVGWRYGLEVRLARGGVDPLDAELLVIDTNSRPLSPADASERMELTIDKVGKCPLGLIYKKTDSVLRGPVASELAALMRGLGRRRVLLAPANPSLGRTIEHGRYLIDGVPLDQTTFAEDPEYPATTANVLELLRDAAGYETHVVELGKGLPSRGILVGLVAQLRDVRAWANVLELLDDGTLPAGGSEFFEAILEARGLEAVARPIPSSRPPRVLVVCGSTSRSSREALLRASHQGLEIQSIPDPLFNSPGVSWGAIEAWCRRICSSLEKNGHGVVAILQPIVAEAKHAQELARCVAQVVRDVLALERVDELMIEGGATASAILKKMDWRQFMVCGEWARGVVRLQVKSHGDTYLTVKPGSYHWPAGTWLSEIL
jgi:uncharacterized protein YgbK (DUF1537 family)